MKRLEAALSALEADGLKREVVVVMERHDVYAQNCSPLFHRDWADSSSENRFWDKSFRVLIPTRPWESLAELKAI